MHQRTLFSSILLHTLLLHPVQHFIMMHFVINYDSIVLLSQHIHLYDMAVVQSKCTEVYNSPLYKNTWHFPSFYWVIYINLIYDTSGDFQLAGYQIRRISIHQTFCLYQDMWIGLKYKNKIQPDSLDSTDLLNLTVLHSNRIATAQQPHSIRIATT